MNGVTMRAMALAAVVAVTVAGAGASAAGEQGSGRFDLPRAGFAPPDTTLVDADPAAVGLDPGPLDAAAQRITDWAEGDPQTDRPLFAGAVGLLVHDGAVVARHTAGSAVRYGDAAGTELPAAQQMPMRTDTIFDLASVSKLFTSIAVLQLVEQGAVQPGAPVAEYLPEFAVNGKAGITVEQLLTHTSGLEPFLPLWQDWPDEASRIRAVLDVAPVTPPGTAYEYSDLNLITLGVLVERLTGAPLDEVVAQRITEPLGMTDTGYNPPAAELDRIAATEYQAVPPRGMVRGEVHDENAWSLGGVAGHAGVFSTAGDLAVLGQTILNGGAYGGERILRPESVRAMLEDYNAEFPGDAHGLGFELDQIWYMGGLSSPATAGHTGFTGTSLVIDLASRSVAVLLTNRVHPSRSWGSINTARQTWATGLARAMAVRPARGADAWYSAIGNDAAATLTTAPLAARSRPIAVRFNAFVDSESTDPLVLEASRDGRSWTVVPLRAHGPGAPRGVVEQLSGNGHRAWWNVSALIPRADEVALRWRYTTDTNYTGRGNHLDAIQVVGSRGILLDGERNPDALDAAGWTVSPR